MSLGYRARLFGDGISRVALCVAFASAVTPQVVMAQSGQGTQPNQGLPDSVPAPGGEIVVTAQGREQRLQDVPISATVIGGEALRDANLRNLEELATRLPAVKLTPGPASDLINIRGVGSGLNSGFEQSVATFVDGVFRGRSRSSRAALFDIERVEVLKGPQTTFFGNNAIAGALNITTRTASPGGSFEYNASALYAPTDGEFALEAGASVPLSDRLGVRVAAKYFGIDGYVYNSFLDQDGPNQKDFVARGSIAWEPFDALRTDLRIDYGRFRDQNSFPNEIVGCPPEPPYPSARGLCLRYLNAAGVEADDRLNQRTASHSSRFELDYVEVALRNELNIGDHVLSAITSHYDHDVYNNTQLAPFPLAGVNGQYPLFPTFAPEQYSSFSQELRIASPTGETIEYLAGAYFARADLQAEQTTGFYFSPFGNNAPAHTTATTPIASRVLHDQEDATYSIFAAATLNATDALRLNAGLRYSIVHKEAERSADVGIGGEVPGVGFTELPIEAQTLLRNALVNRPGNFSDPTRTDRKLMPSVSVQYDLTPDMMTYASYTKGFKAGGFAVSTNGDTFGPETVDAYEVGLKGSAFDRILNFSLAAFLSEYDDLQESTNVVLPSGATQAIVGNVARARSKGIELGLSARVTDFLTLSSDVAYLDARYVAYPGAPCTILQTLARSPCTQDLSGERRAYAPEWSGNFAASLELPLGGYQLQVDPNLYFTSGYFQQASADPLTRQDSFTKLDLRVAFGPSHERWELAVIGKNITDVSTGSFRNNVPTTPGTVYALSDRPRSVALQFSFRN
jgi:outer membrane receptor protein involved in Fe transport